MEPEPHFATVSPTILISNLQYIVEVGTYVSFYNENSLRYGQIVNCYVAAQQEEVMVTLNRYLTRDVVESTNTLLTLPTQLSNRFIGVSELFVSSLYLDVSSRFLHGIIFVFKPDVFKKYPYEGSENVFCIRYKLEQNGYFSELPSDKYLPFPCSYPSFPNGYVSYAKTIDQNMQKIKLAIVRIMCRDAQARGRTFILGGTNFIVPPQFWTYLKFVCNSVQVHGPFTSRRKKLTMRSLLDVCNDIEETSTEVIRFQSVSEFKCFDNVFGKYSRYGTSEPKPSSQSSTRLQSHHRIFTWGDGIEDNEVGPLKRRNVCELGADFTYNLTTNRLSIKLRYEQVSANTDTVVCQFAIERQQIFDCSTTSRQQDQIVGSVRVDYRSSIKSGSEFVHNDVAYGVKFDYTEEMAANGVVCEVLETLPDGPEVGSERYFDLCDVHNYILASITSNT